MMQQPELGKRIAELRRAKGWTQEELAEQCGFNVRTLQRIESGSAAPRKYTLGMLSQVLEASWDDAPGKTYGKRVWDGVRDLFNLKTQKMAKISFLSTVLLSTGLSALLFTTEVKAQTTETMDDCLIALGEDRFWNISLSDPIKPRITTSGSDQVFHLRKNTIELRNDSIYLNDVFVSIVEKGDTIFLPRVDAQQITELKIGKAHPVEFFSHSGRKILYQLPEEPKYIFSTKDKPLAYYTFKNGVQLVESNDSQIFLDKEYQFDVTENDTVILSPNWKLSVRRGE